MSNVKAIEISAIVPIDLMAPESRSIHREIEPALDEAVNQFGVVCATIAGSEVQSEGLSLLSLRCADVRKRLEVRALELGPASVIAAQQLFFILSQPAFGLDFEFGDQINFEEPPRDGTQPATNFIWLRIRGQEAVRDQWFEWAVETLASIGVVMVARWRDAEDINPASGPTWMCSKHPTPYCTIKENAAECRLRRAIAAAGEKRTGRA